ncbi:GrpB family protein [Mycobacteroides chelonae]
MAETFRCEDHSVESPLGQYPARMQYLGSTAVPGLAAKPIIDLQKLVTGLEVAEAVAGALAPHQWHYAIDDSSAQCLGPYNRERGPQVPGPLTAIPPNRQTPPASTSWSTRPRLLIRIRFP